MAASSPKKSAPRKSTKKSPPAGPSAVTEPTTVSQFRRNLAGHLLTLPSGHTVEVRRPGIQEFMVSGLIPDSLTPVIQDMISQAEKKSPSQLAAQERRLQAKMKEAMSDPNQIAEMLRSMQRIAAGSWLRPKLAFHERKVIHPDGPPTWETIPRAERDEESYLYTDEVDQEDLTFTFNYVSGGDGDVERFRQQSGASVASVRGRSDVEVSPE